VLAQFRMEKLSHRTVADLSYGSRKLADIARALVGDPQLILLDEPTSGLDMNEQLKVQELLADLVQQRRTTVIMVEHHMDIVRSVATRVIGLQAGSVVADGNPEEVLDSAEFRAALVGTTAATHDPGKSDGLVIDK
jgi:branched-chain amino acid transport system ATP-binding protein